MNETRIESVLEKLKSLKMKTAAENLTRILQQAENAEYVASDGYGSPDRCRV